MTIWVKSIPAIVGIAAIIYFLTGCASVVLGTPGERPAVAVTITPTSDSGIDSPVSTSEEIVVPSPNPSLPPTSKPTMDAKESQAYVLRLLSANGNCMLPCFLGIIPGKTNWDVVKNQFVLLGKELPKSRFYEHYGVKTYNYQYRFENHVDLLGVSFYVKGNDVPMLAALIRPQKDDAVEKHYSVRSLLTELGKPEEVFIEILGIDAAGPGKNNPIRLTVSYDRAEFWLIAAYEGVSLKSGDMLKFCPTNLFQGISTGRADHSIRLFIQPGDNLYTERDLREMGVGGNPLLRGRTIEDATGKVLEDFYTAIKDSDDEVCFFTPIQLWE